MKPYTHLNPSFRYIVTVLQFSGSAFIRGILFFRNDIPLYTVLVAIRVHHSKVVYPDLFSENSLITSLPSINLFLHLANYFLCTCFV